MAVASTKTAQKLLKRLRKRREQLGLSQAAVGEVIGVNPSYIGLLERGERVPSLDVLLALCRAVELSPAELFADEAPPPSAEPKEVSQLRVLVASWPVKHRKALLRVAKEIGKLTE